MKCEDEAHQTAMRSFETTEAHLKVASLALDKLVTMVTRIGGFLATEDQHVLADAKIALELIGYRKPERSSEWVDRKCTCMKHPFSNGRDLMVYDPSCPIEDHQRKVSTRPKGSAR